MPNPVHDSTPDPDMPKAGGVTDAELLQAKSSASILYLISTLERFETLTFDQIREIGFEIGLLAEHGVDFTTADKRYNLRMIPGEKFTGLELMCLFYSSFQKFAPELDLKIDLKNEYDVAAKLHKAGKP
jgi:hypothetical protein